MLGVIDGVIVAVAPFVGVALGDGVPDGGGVIVTVIVIVPVGVIVRFGVIVIVGVLEGVGVITSYIKQLDNKPTSVIFVSRTESTPDFIPFREADYFITEDQISEELLLKTNIFHTTCFALSKQPAQSAILEKAKRAFNLGCKLSIDVNYAKKLWDSQEEAIEVVIEAKDDNDKLFLDESADLLFHYLMLLQAKGFKMNDVASILNRRNE